MDGPTMGFSPINCSFGDLFRLGRAHGFRDTASFRVVCFGHSEGLKPVVYDVVWANSRREGDLCSRKEAETANERVRLP